MDRRPTRWRGSLGPRGRSPRPAKAARAAMERTARSSSRACGPGGLKWTGEPVRFTHTLPDRSADVSVCSRTILGVRRSSRASRASRGGAGPVQRQTSYRWCAAIPTLKEVSFTSWLSDRAFYGVDHHVNDQSIFPGAGFLEMACISGNIACEERVRQIRDIVWIQPFPHRPANAAHGVEQYWRQRRVRHLVATKTVKRSCIPKAGWRSDAAARAGRGRRSRSD